MPIERRDILFYFSEAQRSMEADKDIFGSDLPKDFRSLRLNNVWSSREIAQIRSDMVSSVRSAMHQYGVQEPVVAFSCAKKNLMGAEKNLLFITPERLVKESLIKHCAREKIMLPKTGKKSLIVDNLMLGIRVDISDQLLTLED